MRWIFGAGVIIGLSLASAPVMAQVSQARVQDACINAALRQVMVYQRTTSRSPLRDRSGAVIGTVLGMDVRFVGRTTAVTCTFTNANSRAVVTVGRPPPEVPPVSNGDVLRACRRAAQDQKLMIDTVVSEAPIRDRQGLTTGRRVVLSVFQSGRPAQVQCDFDYVSRSPALQIQRR
jgi:hypothetical protein